MSVTVFRRAFPEPPLRINEILRYAGCADAAGALGTLLEQCVGEIRQKLSYRVCSCVLPVSVREDLCDFGAFRLQSADLARNLNGCTEAVLFAATVGVESDRLIAKYGRLSPTKALLFQAIGAERIEALCDAFCGAVEQERGITLRPRFSPGYGDLPLECQKTVFSVLDCSRQIGLSLNESLLMSPSKSVTAFAGITSGCEQTQLRRCGACTKQDCAFRGAI